MPTPSSTIQLKKSPDARSTLTVIRADGTRTWCKLNPVFPEHDLTHFAVESVLGATQAFFGLIAEGWSIDDFGLPGTARRIPREAIWIETIVGQFDLDRDQGHLATAEGINERVALAFSARHQEGPPPLSEEQVTQIVKLQRELAARWEATATGETLEIAFPHGKIA